MSSSNSSPSASALDAAVTSLSYEQARSELTDIVASLEQGNLPLEESLAMWERGEALARRCQAWLDGAYERLNAAREVTNNQASEAEDSAEDMSVRANAGQTSAAQASPAQANAAHTAPTCNPSTHATATATQRDSAKAQQ